MCYILMIKKAKEKKMLLSQRTRIYVYNIY